MHTYMAKVVRVVDGDTIDVDIDLGFSIVSRQRLRLARIDAPEVRGESKARGTKATEYVEDKLHGFPGVIVTTTKGKEKYGRYIAEVVIHTGENLSDLLLSEGLAEEYKG